MFYIEGPEEKNYSIMMLSLFNTIYWLTILVKLDYLLIIALFITPSILFLILTNSDKNQINEN